MKRDFFRWKSPQVAAVSAMACGMLTHLYALTNNLQNCDSIAQQPYGYGTGVTSGRWLLNLLGDFFQFWGVDYNLPVVDVFLFLLILAVSAGFLVSTLEIRSHLSAALIGGLMTVFPSVTATIFFIIPLFTMELPCFWRFLLCGFCQSISMDCCFLRFP